MVVHIQLQHLIVFDRHANHLQRWSADGILFSLSFKTQKQVTVA